MLRAILDGKGRTIPEGLKAGDSLRKVYKVSEDLLTATVFERLAYLDGPTFWSILRATFRPDVLPDRKVVELAEIEFWPRWSKANPTLEQDVEPDVILRFSVGDPSVRVTLVVECKLGGWQEAGQWRREWIAHEMEFAGDDAPDECFFLALGGLGAFKGKPQEMVSAFAKSASVGASLPIVATAADWSNLLHALHTVEVKAGPERRIVEDIRRALALHGYRRVRPLGDLAFPDKNRVGSFALSAEVIRPMHGLPTAKVVEPRPRSLSNWPERTASWRSFVTMPGVMRFRRSGAEL